jgi:hypothetical protein
MAARFYDDVAVLAADVDTWQPVGWVANVCTSGDGVDEVAPSAAGQSDQCRWDSLGKCGFELGERLIAVLRWIDVDR